MQSVKSPNFEDYAVEDFIDMLYFKNNLECLSSKELVDQCSDVITYGWAIDKANIVLDSEPVFFLLDEQYIEKMYHLIDTYRFRFYVSDILKVSNEVISQLNSLTYLSSVHTDSRLEHYRLWQQDCRKLDFESHEDLKISIATDALVYIKLLDGDSSIKLAEGDIVSSLNYFASVYPAVFEDLQFYSHAIQYLDSFIGVPFYKKFKPIYQYAKESKEGIQRLKKS